jgi:serine/threonine protein kinase
VRVCPRCRSTYASASEFCGIDGERLVEQAVDALIGERVDRYEFVERLGAGAVGVVYRARHTQLGRDFAIKVLYGEYGADKQLVARFRREAQAVSQMNHPNIIGVVDFGSTEQGLNFLVMEHLQGHTLAEVLAAEHHLTPTRAARIAIQVVAALGEAHRLGFVHRDVKPANVMLIGGPEEELVKLLDFGIVGMADPTAIDTNLTATGRIVGTPRYMSPEQARNSRVGPSADLYSLGVMLYEMLSGEVPFPGDALADVLVMHSTVPPTPLAPARGLENLAMALLGKVPEHRPADAAEVIATIERLFPELVSTSADETPTERPRPAVIRATSSPGLRPISTPRQAALEVVGSRPPLDDEGPLPTPPLAEEGSDPPAPSMSDPPRRRGKGASLYDATPPPLQFNPLPRPTSGFDTPGTAAMRALSVKEGAPLSAAFSTHTGSDQFAVSEPPPRHLARAGLYFAGAFGAVAAIFLGFLALRGEPAKPRDEVLVAESKIVPLTMAPTATVGNTGTKRTETPAPILNRTSAPNKPAPAAPNPNVAELELRLGHVLSQRGLTLADLELLPNTRRLAKRWRTSGGEQEPAVTAPLLTELIEATRGAPLTHSVLKQKLARVQGNLRNAVRQGNLGAKDRAELEKRLRVVGQKSRRRGHAPGPLFTQLTAIEQDLAAGTKTGP